MKQYKFNRRIKENKLLQNLLQNLNPYGFVEEVGFSLETGDGYSHHFSGYREEGGFQNEWGT